MYNQVNHEKTYHQTTKMDTNMIIIMLADTIELPEPWGLVVVVDMVEVVVVGSGVVVIGSSVVCVNQGPLDVVKSLYSSSPDPLPSS